MFTRTYVQYDNSLMYSRRSIIIEALVQYARNGTDCFPIIDAEEIRKISQFFFIISLSVNEKVYFRLL
jgi:hypothetical protein